jgi:colicin import membrane protein
MKFLDTPHKKKSAGLTLLTAILLLLFFFVLGLTYYDPPVSYGVEVNFGTSALGSGEVQPQKVVAATSTPNENPTKTEKSTPKDIPQPQKIPSSEPVLTEKESTVSLPKKKNTIKSTTSTEEKKETPPKKIEPQVSEVTKSVVSNLVKNTSQKAEGTQGQGEDMESGDKGKEEGSPYASSYYNNAGLGGISKGYGLNGRNLQSNGKVVQECNQEGTVVVRITVNKQGDVITAEPGVKGSTNTHPCLLTPAKETALLHKWYPDNKAPEQQIGFVVIQFKLGE